MIAWRQEDEQVVCLYNKNTIRLLIRKLAQLRMIDDLPSECSSVSSLKTSKACKVLEAKDVQSLSLLLWSRWTIERTPNLPSGAALQNQGHPS